MTAISPRPVPGQLFTSRTRNGRAVWVVRQVYGTTAVATDSDGARATFSHAFILSHALPGDDYAAILPPGLRRDREA